MLDLEIEEIEVGNGDVVANGHKVSIHCTGLLESGEKFDSSIDRGQPFEFVVGSTDVIKGLSMGVCGMKAGGRRKFTLPPKYAYGAEGFKDVIPPNSILVYEVEMLDFSFPPFPFDIFAFRDFPGEIGQHMEKHGDSCCLPPFPWGLWVYGHFIGNHCLTLPGDMIELGVGAGGTSLFLAEFARVANRKVYSLDTFIGLPEPDKVLDNPYWRAGMYAGVNPLAPRLRRLAKDHGLDDVIIIKEGLFADTLPTLPVDTQFCFAHLDSDLYTSIMDSLNGVYDRVVDGGMIVIDDFFHHAQGPARAVSDFFNQRGISPVYHVSFPYSVGIFKGEQAPSQSRRSLDGNTYSFDWLYKDQLLRRVVEESAARCAPGSRQKRNAELLLEVISTTEQRPSNLYTYFSALEDFWDTYATGAAPPPSS